MVDIAVSGFEDLARVFEPRIFFVQKVTAVQGSYRPQLEREAADLRMAFEMVAQSRAVGWDAIFAPDEFPTPAPADDGVDFRADLARRNEMACQNSDALVIDSFGNGTAYVGHIEDRFLNGPLPRQVAVLKFKGNTDFSRAWEGFLEAHPRAEIIEFSDSMSLTEGARTWMKKHAESIELMPQRRRHLDDKWRPVSAGVLRGLRGETPEVRAVLATVLGLSPRSLHALASNPQALAGLCVDHFMTLQERYSGQISEEVVLAGAALHFSPGELRMWRRWGSAPGVPEQRAFQVLRHELAQRDLAGVNKNQPMLLTMDAWIKLDRRIARG